MRDFIMPKCPEKWTYEERMFYRGIQEALETLAMPMGETDLTNSLKKIVGAVMVDGKPYIMRTGTEGEDGYITFVLEE